MRKNKFTKKYTSVLATFCAVLTAASACALSFGGCDGDWLTPSTPPQSSSSSDFNDNGCKHDVGTWTTLKAATCMEPGKEQGLCAECFQEVTRTIPVDPNAHVYGGWEVTKTPTKETVGKAKKVCTLNKAHTLEVELPVLTDSRYTTEVVKLPSALGDGERQYSFEHSAGAVTFIEPISANGIQTVRDAVEVASSQASHDLIRRAEGNIGWEYHCPEFKNYDDPESGGIITRPKEDQRYIHDFSYEFGDDYTHIDKSSFSDNIERFYFMQDGELYGFADDGTNFVNEIEQGVAEAENYFDGFRFTLMAETRLGAFFGTENLLEGLYRLARLSDNEDFVETMEEDGGETVYSFQFGHHDGNVDDGRFGTVRVQFTMTEEYTVSWLSVKSIVYPNNEGLNTSTGGRFNTWELVEVNGKEVARAKSGVSTRTSAHYIDLIEIYQETIQETEGEPVPQNPYPLDSTVFSSFDFIYNGQAIGENDVLECEASRAVYFKIDNIYPEAALQSGKDKFRYYYRDKKGVDHEIDFSSLDMVGMTIYTGSNAFFRSHIAGEIELVIKTVNLEKVIHLNVKPISPSAIYPTAFVYTRSGYFENKMSTTERVATVYAGQPLYFAASSSALEEDYTDPSSTSSVTQGASESYTLVDNVNTAELPLSIQGANVTSVSKFVSNVPGEYTITMRCKKDASVSCSIKVVVEEAPTVDEILSNAAYMQELNYPLRGKVSVNFAWVDGVREAYIDFNGRVTTLLCTYDENTGKLTTTNKDGEGLFGDTVYNFTLSLNEAYDLVLSHPIGAQLGGLTETVILYRDINAILTGDYAGMDSTGAAVSLSFYADSADKQLRAEVTYQEKKVVLLCSYSVTQGTLTSVVEEGELSLNLAFNRAYELVLTCGEERIVLIKQ